MSLLEFLGYKAKTKKLDCDGLYPTAKPFESALMECKAKTECKAVMDWECGGTKFFFCNKLVPSVETSNGCVYPKSAFG